MLSHLLRVHSSDPNFSIKCDVPECQRTFRKARSYHAISRIFVGNTETLISIHLFELMMEGKSESNGRWMKKFQWSLLGTRRRD